MQQENVHSPEVASRLTRSSASTAGRRNRSRHLLCMQSCNKVRQPDLTCFGGLHSDMQARLKTCCNTISFVAGCHLPQVLMLQGLSKATCNEAVSICESCSRAPASFVFRALHLCSHTNRSCAKWDTVNAEDRGLERPAYLMRTLASDHPWR